jgi:hypothetical protein
MRRHGRTKTILAEMDVAFMQSRERRAAENPCRASRVNGKIASFAVRALTHAFVSRNRKPY